MTRRISVIAAGLFLSMLWSAEVAAQATAQISGSIRDQSGAVLPGVDVAVTQTDTGIVRTTVTNETGFYLLPNLAIGPYRLEAMLSGFRTYVQTGIVLQVNSSPVVDVVLRLGEVAEQVQVQANASLVETRNTGVGQVMENQRILELPLNGRQVTDLITLAGGAVQTGSTRANNSGQMNGAPFISVGGGLGFGVAYTLDGANHLNFINVASMPIPFPDALQEFKVETSGLSAQHGKETAVNVVTKSGTNEFHGGLFEFLRNDLFNARRFFAATRSDLKRNQFGGTLGGPIAQNRLFFFGGYQSTSLREDPSDFRAFLPTPSVLAGDWRALASPACNAGRSITLRGPFVNNTIDPRVYSAPALEILRRLNQVGPEPCGEVTFGRRIKQDENQFVGRVDYQVTNNQSLFGRYVLTGFNIGLPFEFTPDNLLTTGGQGGLITNGQDNLAHSLALGHTAVVGTNLVNELRMSFNRLHAVVLGPDLFSACDVGVRTYCGDYPSSIALQVASGFVVPASGAAASLGSRFPPTSAQGGGDYWSGRSIQISNDVTLVRGRHQIGLGGSLMRGRHTEFSRWHAVGLLAFSGQTTGLGMGDFLTGQVSGLTTGGPVDHSLTQYQAALYGSDVWQAHPRVTLNYGLRWEPFLPQAMTNGRVYTFDVDKFRQGVKSTVFKNAPAGFSYLGDPGFPGESGIDTRWAQFGPRVGLAWDVKGDGRTSVRAAWAYQYDFVGALWREDYSAAAPWTNFMTVNGVSLEDPWARFPGGNPFPATIGPDARFVPYTSFQVVPRDVRTPVTSSWNLTLQRQFGRDWAVSASYIGTQASHVWTQRAANPAVFIPGGPCTLQGVVYNPCSSTSSTNQRRRLSLENPAEGQYIGALSVLDDGGTQSYNGLLLSAQHRAARGVTVSTNYTWAHCIGDYADLTSAGPDANETYTIPDNRNADRGDCNTDRRHVVNLTAVAEAPTFSNSTVHMLASGWRVAGIYRRSSGPPVTVVSGQDRALNGIFNQRPNQVLDNPYGDRSGRPGTNWLNPAAFALPALGTYGDVGRNSVVGPPTWSFDMALSRVFRLGDRDRLEARVEAYNVTNSFRPSLGTLGQGLYTQNLSTGTFGVVRESLDPRILQFALKYMF